MKEALKTFILSGTIFGIIMGTFAVFIWDLSTGIFAGIISGLLFGLTMSIFVFIQSKVLKKNIQENVSDKKIIFEGGANHFMGFEGVGGRLCLNDEELVFKSHIFNIQNHTLTIPVNQIKSVQIKNTLGFIPNGLQVITNNSVEKFVVFKRKKWMQKINEAIELNNRSK
mgnify:CR=1 FL=1